MINLPKGVDLNELLLFLRNIGLQSSITLRNFEQGSISLYDSSYNLPSNLDTKDPVTAADLAVNKLVKEAFLLNYPNLSWEIITEEDSKNVLYNSSKSEWVWLIDPLDGTKDFIQETGEYAVHFGLIFKNKPILGMVLLPRRREIWFGVDGLGTWKEDENSLPLKREYVGLSKTEVQTVVTSKNHNNHKLDLILKEMNYRNVLRMGSIGFKICSLLRNEADIYISISGKTSPKDWDLAAPHSLMSNASCSFTYVSGSEINYDKSDYLQKGCIVASTLAKRKHIEVCERINKIINKFNL